MASGLDFEWRIPKTNRPSKCKPCYLAIVEKGLQPKLDWDTQVHKCPDTGYVGPFDLTLTIPTCGYSVRALAASKIGTDMASLRRDSDNATARFKALDTGWLDQLAAATFAGASQLFLQSWLDQGPGAFDTLSTNAVDPSVPGWPGEQAMQPGYDAVSINTGPAFNSATAASGIGCTSSQAGMDIPSSYTLFAVADSRSTGIAEWDIQDLSDPMDPYHVSVRRFAAVCTEGSEFQARWGDATGGTSWVNSWGDSGVFGPTWSYFEATLTPSPGDKYIRDVTTFTATQTSGPTAGGYAPPYPIALWAGGFTGLYLHGSGARMAEFMIFPALPLADRQRIRQNIGDFYGLPVAP
jgi:hypothetical protein